MNTSVTERKYYVEIAVTILLIADLFLQAMPIVPVGLLLLLYVLLRCNNYERVFFLLACYSPIVGSIFNTMGIGGIGGWSLVLGVALIVYLMVLGDRPLRNVDKALFPFVLVLVIFTISALTTTGGNYAYTKIVITLVEGGIGIIAFLVFYNNYDTFDTRKVGVFYIMLSVMMLRLSIVTNQISGPQNIFDFGFLRAQTSIDDFETLNFAIGYQYLGFLCVQGMGFYLMSNRIKVDFEKVFVLVLAFLIVMYAGSRQAIVTTLAIIALWLLQLRGGQHGKGWIVMLFGLVLLFFVIQSLLGEEGLFNSVGQEGYIEGGGRGPWILRGIELFFQEPIWGVGYGRYNIFNTYGTYPHNMVIELLCETGIVGFLIVLSLSLNSILRNKLAFRCVLYLFISMFLRAMASAGMNDNMDILALLFCLPALTLKKVKSD